MIFGDGWNDDFVGGDESMKLYNKIRADHPGTPVAMYFGDIGHPRSQDKDDAFLRPLQDAWMNYYVRDERTGTKPPENVQMKGFTCPSSDPSSGPYTFDQWSDAVGAVGGRFVAAARLRDAESFDLGRVG